MNQAPGRVYLVEAGCGAADLITVRGLSVLRACDVVVYDDLIAPELPDAAPPQAERIYMGKRSGRHAASQQEICRLLIEKARAGKTVVRLKGAPPLCLAGVARRRRPFSKRILPGKLSRASRRPLPSRPKRAFRSRTGA